MRAPDGKAAGTRVSSVTCLGDIVPTILDAAGLPRDPALPGRALFGELPPERVITGTYVPQEFVVRWPQKLIRQKGVGTVSFDLVHDPKELEIHPAQSTQFDELARQAFPHDRTYPAPHAIGAIPPDELAALRALGYGGGDQK